MTYASWCHWITLTLMTELPRTLRALWRQDDAPRRSRGLTREAIVNAAIELADADGLDALSMARLAQRVGSGTMSLYRHVANKDELLTFMVSAAPGPPPTAPPGADWRTTLENWADGLWDVYHRHPWILQAVSAGPPADPGQISWLNAGLTALSGTGLAEHAKLTAVIAVLHYTRGAAAVSISTAGASDSGYPDLLRHLIVPDQFPAVAAALDAGAFDDTHDGPAVEFHSGLAQLLDGINARVSP